MTLTSEKTATKRHAWLVGATTAAMAVALIGVGPIAANAAPGDGLGVTVTPQSSSAAATLGTVTTNATSAAISAGAGDLGFTATITQVNAQGVTVTVPLLNSTPAPVNFDISVAAGNQTIVVAPDATNAPAAGDYTLTLTPNTGLSGAPATNGAVTQKFTVSNTGAGGAAQIYVAGSLAAPADPATPVALSVPVVKYTFGSLPTGSTLVVTQSGNAAGVGTENVTSAPTVSYLPANASYTAAIAGTKPPLSQVGVGNYVNPFRSTTVSDPSSKSFSESWTVASTVSAPQDFGAVTLSSWSAPVVSPFSDINSSTQFYSEMTWLNSTGISTGYKADNGFHPAATIKRNAEAAFLYRLAGSPVVTSAQEKAAYAAFSDVTANTQFHDAIAWLYNAGITSGYSDGTFRPAAEVTRGAMAAFLYRFVNNDPAQVALVLAGSASINTLDAASANYESGTFVDVSRLTQFSGDIAWLANAGNYDNANTEITTGYADGGFHAAASIKRNAMAAFLYRVAGGTVD